MATLLVYTIKTTSVVPLRDFPYKEGQYHKQTVIHPDFNKEYIVMHNELDLSSEQEDYLDTNDYVHAYTIVD